MPHTVGLSELFAKAIGNHAERLWLSEVNGFREAQSCWDRRVVQVWVLEQLFVRIYNTVGVATEPILDPMLEPAHRGVLVVSVQHEHLSVLRHYTLGCVDHLGSVETLSAIKKLD